MARAYPRPGLLLAMPVSADPNLSGAVVLLAQHDRRGSFGFVINRPSDVPASQLLHELDMPWHGKPGEVLWRGGPVSPENCWILHEPVHDATGTLVVTPRISVSLTPDRLRAIGTDPPEQLRIVLGSIDWAGGQITADGAVYTEATPELVFATPHDALWDRVHAIGIRPLGPWLRRVFGPALPKATLRRK